MGVLRHPLVAALRRHLAVIACSALVAAAVAWVSTPRPAVYRAHATLFTGQAALAYSSRTHRQSNVSVRVGLLADQTLAPLVSALPTAAFAAHDAGVDRAPGTVAAETHASPVPGAELLDVTVTDPDPGTAAALANATASALTSELRAVIPTDPPPPVQLFDAATRPTARVPSSPGTHAWQAALFGAVVAAGAALAVERVRRGGPAVPVPVG